MRFLLILILLCINIPVYKFVFKIFFKDSEGFNESIKYSFTPDIFSLFKGEYFKDNIAEAKLGFFIMSCIVIVSAEYFIINSILGWLF